MSKEHLALLSQATKVFKKQLDADPKQVVTILGKTVAILTEQLAKINGKSVGEIGGEAIMEAVKHSIDPSKLFKTMPGDWNTKEKELAEDLEIHAISLAACTFVLQKL